MIKIVFVVAVITMQGPHVGNVQEVTKFETVAQCDEFGASMKDRVADWVRGYHKQDWDFPVKVVWKCEAEGDPA